MRPLALSLSLLLLPLWAHPAAAAPTPWLFDFDPNISKDPSYVKTHLATLKAGLPGLPSDSIGELTSKQTKLYFYQDVIDVLLLAKGSGPGIAPPVTRTPKRCVAHGAFAKPALLRSAPPPGCAGHEQALMARFGQRELATCAYVEFPERYVYDHQPLSLILPTTTTNLELLIAILGEALTHVQYPTKLIPAGFLPRAREVLAKVRYATLKQELGQRRASYQQALADLSQHQSCYEPAALTSFSKTVAALIAELAGAEQDLDALHNAGLAQAVKDRKAIEAQGRKRADLPYPSLTDRDRELLAFYLGGLVWRVRGAGLINEDKIPLGLALTFVSAPYQLIGDIAGGVDGQGVGLPIYISENWGYYKWYDMGTDPGSNDKYADLVEMTNRGKRATELVAPLLAGRGFDTRHLVAGGLMMGPCYYYIWEELPAFKLGLPCKTWPGAPWKANTPGCLGAPHYMQFLEWPTAAGEFCTGAALALGLVKTLLRGKPGAACTPDCFGKPCGASDTCGGTCSVCADAGTAVGPDGSAVAPDGGSSVTDRGADQRFDAGASHPTDGAARRDQGIAAQPGASGGCAVGARAPLGLLGVLVLLAMLLAAPRRCCASPETVPSEHVSCAPNVERPRRSRVPVGSAADGGRSPRDPGS
ncbi:MAG: hypothetical protein KC503_39700 [Myxococcales bacterium]|nr:hypothetical protein [Myxococcales bacterium]